MTAFIPDYDKFTQYYQQLIDTLRGKTDRADASSIRKGTGVYDELDDRTLRGILGNLKEIAVVKTTETENDDHMRLKQEIMALLPFELFVYQKSPRYTKEQYKTYSIWQKRILHMITSDNEPSLSAVHRFFSSFLRKDDSNVFNNDRTRSFEAFIRQRTSNNPSSRNTALSKQLADCLKHNDLGAFIELILTPINHTNVPGSLSKENESAKYQTEFEYVDRSQQHEGFSLIEMAAQLGDREFIAAILKECGNFEKVALFKHANQGKKTALHLVCENFEGYYANVRQTLNRLVQTLRTSIKDTSIAEVSDENIDRLFSQTLSALLNLLPINTVDTLKNRFLMIPTEEGKLNDMLAAARLDQANLKKLRAIFPGQGEGELRDKLKHFPVEKEAIDAFCDHLSLEKIDPKVLMQRLVNVTAEDANRYIMDLPKEEEKRESLRVVLHNRRNIIENMGLHSQDVPSDIVFELLAVLPIEEKAINAFKEHLQTQRGELNQLFTALPSDSDKLQEILQLTPEQGDEFVRITGASNFDITLWKRCCNDFKAVINQLQTNFYYRFLDDIQANKNFAKEKSFKTYISPPKNNAFRSWIAFFFKGMLEIFNGKELDNINGEIEAISNRFTKDLFKLLYKHVARQVGAKAFENGTISYRAFLEANETCQAYIVQNIDQILVGDVDTKLANSAHNLSNQIMLPTLNRFTGAGAELISNGACLDVEDNFGNLPLHYAAQNGLTSLIQNMMESSNPPPIDHANHQKRTALHEAVAHINSTTVQLLLDKNADPNAVDSSGDSPLHIVCTSGSTTGRVEIIVALIKASANVVPKNKKGRDPWALAELNLIKDAMAALSSRKVKNWHALFTSIIDRLDKFEFVNCMNRLRPSDQAQLFKVASQEHIEFWFSSIQYKTYPLQNVEHNFKEVEKRVAHLDNPRSALISNPITAAASTVVPQAVATYVSGVAGSMPMLVTPVTNQSYILLCRDLSQAYPHAEVEHVRNLLTKLENALKLKGYNNIDEGIVSHLFQDARDYLHGIETKYQKLEGDYQRIYIAHEPPLCDQSSQTILHQAVSTINLNAVKGFTSQDEQINTGDKTGITPLHIAAARGNLQIVTYLLEQGANGLAIDECKSTPLHFLCMNPEVDDDLIKIAVDLIDKAPQLILAEDQNGLTPLDYASNALLKGILLEFETRQKHLEIPYHLYERLTDVEFCEFWEKSSSGRAQFFSRGTEEQIEYWFNHKAYISKELRACKQESLSCFRPAYDDEASSVDDDSTCSTDDDTASSVDDDHVKACSYDDFNVQMAKKQEEIGLTVVRDIQALASMKKALQSGNDRRKEKISGGFAIDFDEAEGEIVALGEGFEIYRFSMGMSLVSESDLAKILNDASDQTINTWFEKKSYLSNRLFQILSEQKEIDRLVDNIAIDGNYQALVEILGKNNPTVELNSLEQLMETMKTALSNRAEKFNSHFVAVTGVIEKLRAKHHHQLEIISNYQAAFFQKNKPIAAFVNLVKSVPLSKRITILKKANEEQIEAWFDHQLYFNETVKNLSINPHVVISAPTRSAINFDAYQQLKKTNVIPCEESVKHIENFKEHLQTNQPALFKVFVDRINGVLAAANKTLTAVESDLFFKIMILLNESDQVAVVNDTKPYIIQEHVPVEGFSKYLLAMESENRPKLFQKANTNQIEDWFEKQNYLIEGMRDLYNEVDVDVASTVSNPFNFNRYETMLAKRRQTCEECRNHVQAMSDALKMSQFDLHGDLFNYFDNALEEIDTVQVGAEARLFEKGLNLLSKDDQWLMILATDNEKLIQDQISPEGFVTYLKKFPLASHQIALAKASEVQILHAFEEDALISPEMSALLKVNSPEAMAPYFTETSPDPAVYQQKLDAILLPYHENIDYLDEVEKAMQVSPEYASKIEHASDHDSSYLESIKDNPQYTEAVRQKFISAKQVLVQAERTIRNYYFTAFLDRISLEQRPDLFVHAEEDQILYWADRKRYLTQEVAALDNLDSPKEAQEHFKQHQMKFTVGMYQPCLQAILQPIGMNISHINAIAMVLNSKDERVNRAFEKISRDFEKIRTKVESLYFCAYIQKVSQEDQPKIFKMGTPAQIEEWIAFEEYMLPDVTEIRQIDSYEKVNLDSVDKTFTAYQGCIGKFQKSIADNHAYINAMDAVLDQTSEHYKKLVKPAFEAAHSVLNALSESIELLYFVAFMHEMSVDDQVELFRSLKQMPSDDEKKVDAWISSRVYLTNELRVLADIRSIPPMGKYFEGITNPTLQNWKALRAKHLQTVDDNSAKITRLRSVTNFSATITKLQKIQAEINEIKANIDFGLFTDAMALLSTDDQKELFKQAPEVVIREWLDYGLYLDSTLKAAKTNQTLKTCLSEVDLLLSKTTISQEEFDQIQRFLADNNVTVHIAPARNRLNALKDIRLKLVCESAIEELNELQSQYDQIVAKVPALKEKISKITMESMTADDSDDDGAGVGSATSDAASAGGGGVDDEDFDDDDDSDGF